MKEKLKLTILLTNYAIHRNKAEKKLKSKDPINLSIEELNTEGKAKVVFDFLAI